VIWLPLVSIAVTVLALVVGGAVGYGVLKSTVAGVARQVSELKGEVREAIAAQERSRDKMGERLGAIETRQAVADHELSRPYRSPPR